jgi:twitching motility protein PilT
MLPAKNDTMIPAFELMHVNNAIRSMIRDNKNHQIENAMLAGRAEGMITMDHAILELYKAGQISKETAINYANHPEQITKHL